jgi:hypothetical protein
LAHAASLPFQSCVGPLGDRYFKDVQKFAYEAFTQCQENIVLRSKMKIERALGDVCAVGDLLDRGWPYAVLQEETLGGVHQLFAPLFGH